MGAQGGFINKRPEWRDRKKPNALAVEDPQEPGKDIAAGTFRIPEVGCHTLGSCMPVHSNCPATLGAVDVWLAKEFW